MLGAGMGPHTGLCKQAVGHCTCVLEVAHQIVAVCRLQRQGAAALHTQGAAFAPWPKRKRCATATSKRIAAACPASQARQLVNRAAATVTALCTSTAHREGACCSRAKAALVLWVCKCTCQRETHEGAQHHWAEARHWASKPSKCSKRTFYWK